MRRLLPLLVLSTPTFADVPAPEPGITITRVTHGDALWTVARFDLAEVRLRLVGQAPGDPNRFSGLHDDVWMAMNAGIYETVEVPTGWFVEDGVERAPLNLASGRGNFYMEPNGAFWVDAAGAHVAPSTSVRPEGAVLLATQSGPLLYADGVANAAIQPDWAGRTSRNLVVALDATHVAFVYTQSQVTLGETLDFVRARFPTGDALYLDGTVSDLCVGDCRRPSRNYAGMLVVTGR